MESWTLDDPPDDDDDDNVDDDDDADADAEVEAGGRAAGGARSSSSSAAPPPPRRAAAPSAADVARHPAILGHAFVFAPPREWDTAVPPQLLKLLADFAAKKKTTSIQGERTEVPARAHARNRASAASFARARKNAFARPRVTHLTSLEGRSKMRGKIENESEDRK